MESNPRRFLIIHGHFYQPPRENPWIGKIQREASAAPFHDWNERILHECYQPNSASRILDGQGRVLKIANNYRRISFNFGPTLAEWLQQEAAEVFDRIRQADADSRDLYGGHPSAMAQAYNHMILPLANERDLHTQIRWGIADFRHRFGRDPEAMWLPETAANRRVLSALAEHGMKYVILSPYQAKRVRKMDGRARWVDVSGGRVDTSRPYRWREGTGPEAPSIDILFYHGELSRRVSFDDLLTNAGRFAEAILGSYSAARRDQLVLIATDGETYGHHKPFGDMALAYLLEMELPKTDVIVTNPGQFLELCPPTWEVEIDEGPDGRGSSWSCAHGVGRWFRDCGCSTGGQPGWHQRWRRPLRDALDLLRDGLAQIFEREGGKLFRDPWSARDAYIQMVLERNQETVEAFLGEHCPGAQSREEKVRVLKLLEMQRHAMLMYTSCGWFFAEISGLETRQILRYAARALELAREFGIETLERDFLANLEKAPSNLPEVGNGRVVFERYVRPSAVGFEQIVHDYAMRAILGWVGQKASVFHFDVEALETRRVEEHGQSLLFGTVRVADRVTWESQDLRFAELYRGGIDFRGHVLPAHPDDDWPRRTAALEAALKEPALSADRLLDAMGGPSLRLSHMFEDGRDEIIRRLLKERISEIAEANVRLYEANEQLIEDLAECRYRLPLELKTAASVTLSRRICEALQQCLPAVDLRSFERARYWWELAGNLGVELDLSGACTQVERGLHDLMERLVREWRTEPCVRIVRLLEIARRLQLELDETPLQDWFWFTLRRRLEELVNDLVEGRADETRYVQVAALLRLGASLNFNLDDLKAKVRPIEERLSQDPSFWP